MKNHFTSDAGFRFHQISVSFLLFVTYLFLVVVFSSAQQPELVKDINALLSPNIPTSNQAMAEANGKLFFVNERGYLSVYDGTDFEEFPVSRATNFNAFGTKTIFIAETNDTGRELWYYENGEVHVLDINEGSATSNPGHLTVFGDELVFQATDGTSGPEFWAYDGATLTLHELIDGTTGSEPEYMVAYGSEVVFFATEGSTYGQELYGYDGADIYLIRDIRPGSVGSLGSTFPYFELHSGSLFFVASDGTGNELWEYDGTNVTKIDINPSGGSTPRYLTSFNSRLYFTASTATYGYEFYEFDGENVALIEDIRPGSGSSVPGATNRTKYPIVGNNLYFEADDGTNGKDLYKFDGSTVTLIDVNSNSEDLTGNAFVEYPVAFEDKLFFSGYSGSEVGSELLEYDGSQLIIHDVHSGEGDSYIRWLTIYNDELYFTAKDGDGTTGWHLWKYDGINISPVSEDGKTESSDPYYLVSAGNKVYFSASDGIHGYELWSTDGTTTEMVADQYSGSNDTYNYAMRAIDGKVFYFGSTEEDDLMYVYDGANFETFNVYGSEDAAFIEYNGAVYFQGWTDELGGELYKYDDTGVNLVADIREGSSSSNPSYFHVWNNELYFSAGDGINGRELWKYDGSTVSMVVDVNNSAASSSPQYLTSIGSHLYFIASSDATGRELVHFDGTTATILDIYEGSTGSNPGYLTVFGGKLALQAETSDNGTELVLIDGTSIDIVDVNPAGHSYPQHLFVYKNKLYFRAFSESNGWELHIFDGTNVTLVDLVPGEGNSNPYAFFELGPYMYFGAFSGENPYGIHRYDGTGEMEFLAPVEPSFEEDYGPTNYAVLDNYAYFSGTDSFGDSELYRIRRIEEGNDILTFSLAGQTGPATIDFENHTINAELEFGSSTSNIEPLITISDYATISASGPQDFTNPFVYTVTSEYGESQEWIVTVTVSEVLSAFRQNRWKVYPNPTSDMIYFDSRDIVSFKLLDLNGRVLKQESGRNGQIDISSFQTGLYLLQLTDGAGTKTIKVLKTN